MSWKSLVTAGLLCVLASPAFAVPSLEITNGGLDSSGNWVWNVSIAPSTTIRRWLPNSGSRPMVTLKGVANAAPTSWDTNTPGTSIFCLGNHLRQPPVSGRH